MPSACVDFRQFCLFDVHISFIVAMTPPFPVSPGTPYVNPSTPYHMSPVNSYMIHGQPGKSSQFPVLCTYISYLVHFSVRGTTFFLLFPHSFICIYYLFIHWDELLCLCILPTFFFCFADLFLGISTAYQFFFLFPNINYKSCFTCNFLPAFKIKLLIMKLFLSAFYMKILMPKILFF